MISLEDFAPEKGLAGSIVQMDDRSFGLYISGQFKCEKFIFKERVTIKDDTLYAKHLNYNKSSEVIEVFTKYPVGFSIANMVPDW